jgi:hypothetical protein
VRGVCVGIISMAGSRMPCVFMAHTLWAWQDLLTSLFLMNARRSLGTCPL